MVNTKWTQWHVYRLFVLFCFVWTFFFFSFFFFFVLSIFYLSILISCFVGALVEFSVCFFPFSFVWFWEVGGLPLAQELAGRTSPLTSVWKALTHIFNWEFDCKIETNTDTFSQPNDPKPRYKTLFTHTACRGSQLFPQSGHRSIPQPGPKNRLHCFQKADSTSPISTYTDLSCE